MLYFVIFKILQGSVWRTLCGHKGVHIGSLQTYAYYKQTLLMLFGVNVCKIQKLV